MSIYCMLDYGRVAMDDYDDDLFEQLAELLVEIRQEIIAGNFSLLQKVAEFYGAFEDDEDGAAEEDELAATPVWRDETLTKQQLQQECERRHVSFRKSWNKRQLRDALETSTSEGELSPSAAQLLGYLQRM